MGQCIKTGKSFTSAEPLYKPVKCCCLWGFSVSQTFLWALSTSSFGRFKFIIGGRGNTFTFSSWILQGDISLSWKTQRWHFCVKTLPAWEAASRQPFPRPAPALTGQPPRDSIPSQQQRPWELGAACSGSFSLLKRAKQFPKAASHREFARVAGAQKLPRKGLRPERDAPKGSRDPPATGCSGQHRTWPQLPFPHPHQGRNSSRSSLNLLFTFVPFLGTGFQMFESSPLSTSFPSGLSLQCLIVFHFQTRSPFPFQSLF